MYIENNNKHLTKKHNICIGSHEKQLLLFSLVHLILCYALERENSEYDSLIKF